MASVPAETRKVPSYIEVDGFRLAGGWFPQAFRDFLKYKCRDDDVFLVTYPKCGTTWMHYITFLIYRDGDPPKNGIEFMMSCPFPEAMGVEVLDKMPRPGVIKTHLPFHLTPYSPKAKYIYTARNPKDCCVSFYFHTKNGGMFYDFEGDFNDYFELFFDGKVDYEDYFDHVLSWYSHRNDPNVLMVSYEELKTETSSTILKVAKFLGEEYGHRLEKDPSILKKIVENCTVAKMKETTGNVMEDLQKLSLLDPSNSTPAMKHMASTLKVNGDNKSKFELVRKGIVGDWKNMMTPEQSSRMDEKTEEKMKDTELFRFWKDMGIIA